MRLNEHLTHPGDGGVPARLQARAGGHRVEAFGIALSVGPDDGLAQDEEPGGSGGEAGGGRGTGGNKGAEGIEATEAVCRTDTRQQLPNAVWLGGIPAAGIKDEGL